jgi:hypothetical protein
MAGAAGRIAGFSNIEADDAKLASCEHVSLPFWVGHSN